MMIDDSAAMTYSMAVESDQCTPRPPPSPLRARPPIILNVETLDIEAKTGLFFSLLRDHCDDSDPSTPDTELIAALETVMSAPHNTTVLSKAVAFASASAPGSPEGVSRHALARAHATMVAVATAATRGDGCSRSSLYAPLEKLRGAGRRAMLLCLESVGVGVRKFDAFPPAPKAPCSVFSGCTVLAPDGVTVVRPASNSATCPVLVPHTHEWSQLPYSGSGRGYAILDKLNNAIYGDVVMAVPVAPTEADGVLRCTGEPACAIKRLSKAAVLLNRTSQLNDEDALLELDALAFLTSQLRARAANGGDATTAQSGIVEVEDCLEDDEHLFLVMGFAGEDLFDVLSREGALAEARCKKITRQVLEALATAASFGVAHHDVSIENVLLVAGEGSEGGDETGVDRATLIDWGQCVKAPRDSTNGTPVPIANSLRWPGSYGKPNSEAPEVAARSSLASPPATTAIDVYKTDVFAVGVMLFTLLFGFPPWDLRKNPADPVALKTYRMMTGGRLEDILVHWNIASRVSPEALNLLQAMLSSNPVERPGHSEALNFKWFSDP